jgi:hypothetical protein
LYEYTYMSLPLVVVCELCKLFKNIMKEIGV